MTTLEGFHLVLIKPSKYARDGFTERFVKGFMPNSTLLHIKSMTPERLDDRRVLIRCIDEYVETDLSYLELLRPETCTLLAVVGVQSHQMHRALDLCALARTRGVLNCVIGGPHPMTCDTTEVQGRGVSFALSEAELVWNTILHDAAEGLLQDVYGGDQRWTTELSTPALIPPTRAELRSYVIPMLGIYPARGCPFRCNFCSVVKIAGKRVRSEPVETTLSSLLAAREAGVRLVMFTSDNFNKFRDAASLLEAMIDAKVGLPFLVQCDAQLGKDTDLIDLLARAGCAQVFIGAESFDRATLERADKKQNQPERYADIVRLCHGRGISVHFSNIFGFPEQDESGVLRHLAELKKLRPFMASFYVLTPIPGTEQYEDFLGKDLIFEDNLDRFDATCSVWKHPHIASHRLEALVACAYREFYNTKDVVTKMFGCRWNTPGLWIHAFGLGYASQARLSVRRGEHPMAGGFRRLALDRDEQYSALRRQVYGLERLSLPSSLALPNPKDRALYAGHGMVA